MKADITSEGVLILTPETGVEAFALNSWFDVLSTRVQWAKANLDKGGIIIKPVAQGETP